jgi:opacity protein-like surface antigen
MTKTSAIEIVRRHGVRGVSVLAARPAFRVTLAAWCLAFALPQVARSDESERRWHVRAGVEGGYTDNVRWAEDGSNKEDAFFTTVDGRVGWRSEWPKYLPSRLAFRTRARFYESFSNRDWVEIRPELFYDFRRSMIRLRYRYTPERLRLDEDPDLGNVYAERNYVSAMGEHKFGDKKKWRARLEFESDWDESKESSADGRDSYTPFGTAELRYRLHHLFTPRMSIGYGVRDADDSNYDRDELEVMAGFDSKLAYDVRLRVRYKYLYRDYTVGSETDADGSNSNYDRADDIHQIETSLELPLTFLEGLLLEFHHKYRNSDSDKNSRDFDVNEVRLGVRYEYR